MSQHEWGLQVGVNYDPMIAKVIARGPDRQSALRTMHTALSELQVRALTDFFFTSPALDMQLSCLGSKTSQQTVRKAIASLHRS